jgi:hypothetical protein
MNIKYGKPPIPLSQDAFHALDYQVMEVAFNLHNEIGNLWDEKDYQRELALRGRVINFRPDSLTWRFISTSLRNETRQDYCLKTSTWHPAMKNAQGVLEIMEGILADWGAYLSINLYKEALCHVLGVPLKNERSRFVSLSPMTTLHMSGLSSRKNNLKNNLQKYLNRSNFNELLWINFNQNKIEFTTLHNSA